MSIEERRNEVVEFRLGLSKSGLDVITAASGKVQTGLHSFRTLAEVDEFIEALRMAAKAANLPDGPPQEEAKTA